MMERWNEYTKCASKPITSLIELNIKTFNHWVSNAKDLTEVLQSKNPADYFTAETKLITDASLETMKYVQEASNIWLEAVSQTNKIYMDTLHEATDKVSDIAKSTKSK